MFIHSVYFWLRPDLTAEERERFWQHARPLAQIKSVRAGYIGTPAETDRSVIDRSYSCALVLIFDDQDGHDRYQIDPVHDRFRDQCGALWSKILIYDAVSD
jgi:hypothetical protein